jgi:hypothetical protein
MGECGNPPDRRVRLDHSASPTRERLGGHPALERGTTVWVGRAGVASPSGLANITRCLSGTSRSAYVVRPVNDRGVIQRRVWLRDDGLSANQSRDRLLHGGASSFVAWATGESLGLSHDSVVAHRPSMRHSDHQLAVRRRLPGRSAEVRPRVRSPREVQAALRAVREKSSSSRSRSAFTYHPSKVKAARRVPQPGNNRGTRLASSTCPKNSAEASPRG